MLELKNIRVSYDAKNDVLKDLSLTVPSGEWVGIIGRSGSGKSTLLRSIHLFTRPQSGSIKMSGTELTALKTGELRKFRRKIAFIFQDYNLIDSLTVLENVLTSRLGYQSPLQSLLGTFTEEDYRRAGKAISRVGLEEKMFEKAKNLSGGQKQRVAIAKALCQDADLILADEPVSSLDQGTTIQIMEYFKLIHEKKHKTILINLHNVDLAKKYCQRIVAIDAGRVIYDGPAQQLGDDVIRRLYE
ncbi:MAG: phosphonate ABC transporter ATP-binding protein [Bacillota bacterium]|nr:phosphonate ABC transporter ATP-binding protein [Bacillota bacterium]